jgi:large subunit GTPase 1
MVCDGVLPIDQLREYTGPMGLVAQRIPKWFIEATYGIRIIMRSEEEGGTGIPTAEEVLVAYASKCFVSLMIIYIDTYIDRYSD